MERWREDEKPSVALPIQPSRAAATVLHLARAPFHHPHLFLIPPSLTLFLSQPRPSSVYERWWSARQAFASLGTIAVSLAQRAHVWVRARPGGLDEPTASHLRASICRWATVWHYSVYQMCTFEAVIHPDGAALLTPDERALYAETRKPRQRVVLQLASLLDRAGLSGTQALLMDELLQKVSERSHAEPPGLSQFRTPSLSRPLHSPLSPLPFRRASRRRASSGRSASKRCRTASSSSPPAS